MGAAAGVLVTFALVFYSLGVWAERRDGTLRTWHVLAFVAGLVFDVTGTLVMIAIAGSDSSATSVWDAIMRASGLLAVALMAVHVVVAWLVLVRGSVRSRRTFHRFSVTVWAIWLVPYVAGALAALVAR